MDGSVHAESESFFGSASGSIFDEHPAHSPELTAVAYGSGASDGGEYGFLQSDLRAMLDAARVVVPNGQHVVRMNVTPGEVLELPFGPDAHFLARLGDGNLAIKVGEVTVILQGYAVATNDPQHPVLIESADGHPLDIALLLASTDPGLDIQTAVGPGDSDGGQDAENSGAILRSFASGGGLGGFEGVGAQGDSSGPGGSSGGIGAVAVNNPPPDNATPTGTGPHVLVAADDTYTVSSGHALAISAPGVLGNDSDADGDALKVDTASVVHPADGAFAISDDGHFFYEARAGFIGTDTFTYKATDGTTDSNVATVTINVVADQAPVATNDTYTVHQGQVLDIAAPGLLDNDSDADGDALKVDVASVTGPAHFSNFGMSNDGHFSYEASAGFIGTDTFTYKATDGTTDSNVATVTINVVADQAPVAMSNAGLVAETHSHSIEIAGTAAHEILPRNSTDIRSGGGHDLIFGGSGDETIIFHDGEKASGEGDSATGANLADGPSHGDVLMVDTNLDLTSGARDGEIQGNETISVVGHGGQTVTLDATAVQHLSDHTLDPSGVFNNATVIKFDGDVLDHLYLSITRDGGAWVGAGTTASGDAVYAHETVANDAETVNAYVVVAQAAVANVHPNQDVH